MRGNAFTSRTGQLTVLVTRLHTLATYYCATDYSITKIRISYHNDRDKASRQTNYMKV